MTDSGRSYGIREIEKLTRVSRRSLRNWVKHGLVPAPEFRGSATRYGRVQMAHIFAVKKLRGDYYSLPQIKRWLASKSVDDLEHFAAGPAAPAAATAPPKEPSPPAPVSYPAERWERLVLLPGLELAVRDEPVLRRIAQQIFDHFGTGGRAT